MTQLDRIERLLELLLQETQALRSARPAASMPLHAAAPLAPVRGFAAPSSSHDSALHFPNPTL